MNPTPEVVSLIQTGGAIACLVLAVRWLAGKFTDSQRELVDLLRGVIADNTRTLTEVKDTLKGCKVHNPPKLHEP
jgi:hypothetical protein